MLQIKRFRTGLTVFASLSLLAACGPATPAPQASPTLSTPTLSTLSSGSHRLFIASATEHPDGTVTFPLLHGVTADGRSVSYVVLDSSSGSDAEARGVNRSDKLNNARDTGAVQRVRVVNGQVVFPATVDFTPARRVVPGPTGFPPAVAEPGARGEAGYSPLIQLPDGTVLNAPHLANASGQADKVVSLSASTVTYRETNGFSGGKAVRYVSTESSDSGAAALEGVTYAPKLNAAPSVGDDSGHSARASLAAFVNGQTGAGNRNRQGLNSALLDGLDPLNVLAWAPNQGRYSPLWDVFPAEWTSAAIASGQRTLQQDFGTIRGLGDKGLITAPGGGTFGPGNFIVNCPIVSQE
jgi:hypothetical protein